MESESKHTPGPWKLHLVNDCEIIDERGNLIADACGDYNQPDTWPEMEANARLIAAAPELLGALREIMEYNGGATTAIHDAYVMERAHAAIAKAEGHGL